MTSKKLLSILIPSRNEMFTKRTVEDILKNKRGDTEIIVGLDGAWTQPSLEQHPDVSVIYYKDSIGQRAITNQCAKLAKGKYIMKVDAHCAFDEGFDLKMTNLMQDDITMLPIMRNLWVFNWVCPDAPKDVPPHQTSKEYMVHRRYQSPSGPCKQMVDHCPHCDSINIKTPEKEIWACNDCKLEFLPEKSIKKECGKPTTMEIVWIPKTNPSSTAYRFDRTLHFQYWSDFGKAQTGDLTETMSIQGSCFMSTRDKYFELDLCSEEFGSWGQQGVEVALKTWLSGGRVLVNRTTWYAHMFRTQGGDFSFPYHISGRQVEKNREYSRDLFINDKWPKAVHPFRWIIEKFNPPDWEEWLKTGK